MSLAFWDFLQLAKRYVFYLILFLLPTQLGLHFWPNFSYIGGIRVDYLSPTIFITDLLIFLLFVLIAIFTFFKNKQIYKYRLSPVSGFLFFMWIFVILVGIGIARSPQAGVLGLVRLVEFLLLGIYIAKNDSKYHPKAMLFCIAAGVIFESVLALVQFVSKSSIGGLFYFLGERSFTASTPGIANASVHGDLVLRPYGTLPHPNVLAGFLVIGMNYILGKLQGSKGDFYGLEKLTIFFISTLALLLGSLALLASMSRVAIFLWFLMLLAYFFSWLKKKEQLDVFLMIVASAAILIFGTMFTMLRFRFFDTVIQDESITSRAQLVNSAVQMVWDNPLIGVGLNNFIVSLPGYSKSPLSFYLQPVHNAYLLVACETGIFGIFVFLLFLAKTIKNVALVRQRQFYLLACMVFIVIVGFFDHYFLTVQQGRMMLAFVLGLCWRKK